MSIAHLRTHVRQPFVRLVPLAVPLAFTFLFASMQSSSGTILPDGFAERQYGTGLINPTAMAFAPDPCPSAGTPVHRLFVCEQAGTVSVFHNGVLQTNPFLSVACDTRGERGLDGICFDPNFATNRYVYVYYTIYQANTSLPTHNRLSRFTADPANPDVALAGSETPIMEMDDLSTTAFVHNGGGLHFGLDGKLYVSVGENANGSNSQSLNTVLGKVLRINPIPENPDGTNPDSTFPTDNPFYNNTTGKNRAIYILGLRNPFTFSFQSGTGRLFINDVGSYIWEEINEGVSGGNYGWPTYEGPVEPPPVGFRNPIYAYMHFSGTPSGCAITGGDFYDPAPLCTGDPPYAFPTSYLSQYFFLDLCGDWIYTMDPTRIDPASQYGFHTINLFASDIHGSPTYLITGPDANLYYISRDDGAVYQIYYSASLVPTIGTQPRDQLVGQGWPATFTVDASGAPTLYYRWQRDNAYISGAPDSPTYTLPNAQVATDNGATFRCIVVNSFGSAVSMTALLTVIPQQPPTPIITAPAPNTYYNNGDTISFAGGATDPQDGTLAPSALTWTILFEHHALSNPNHHTHPFFGPTSGIAGGTVTLNFGETDPDVWYRIFLTAIDSFGLSQTTFTDVYPTRRLVNISGRAQIGTGDNALIAGFIIDGTASKQVVLRGIGPSLQVNGTPVPGTLQNPVLELHDRNGALIASNDDWATDANASQVQAAGLAPSDSREAALMRTLAPDFYTVIVRGANNTTGIGLAEMYDLSASSASTVANISARGFVGTGDDVLIGGIIVTSLAPQTVLFRAIGPDLTSAGVANALVDPTLELYDVNGTLISSNDNWKSDQQAQIEATGLAPGDDRDAAILSTLQLGDYTAIVRGSGGTTGVALVEAYALQ